MAVISHFILPFLLGKTMLLSTFPTLLKKGNFSDWYITRNCVLENHVGNHVGDLLVLSVSIFSVIPNGKADFIHKPMDVTYQFKLL